VRGRGGIAAYNQEGGVVQHISSFVRGDDGGWAFSFTQEWPVPVSPGLRWAIDFDSGLQIVPGIAVPIRRRLELGRRGGPGLPEPRAPVQAVENS